MCRLARSGQMELLHISAKRPYDSRFSKIGQIGLRQLLRCYCKSDLDIKLVFFSIFKAKNMFSVKDAVCIMFINPHMVGVMPATLVRPVDTFVQVSASSL